MEDQWFWEIERGFWLGGEAHFRQMMAGDCVMVFPEPAGIMTGENIIKSLESAPRWTSVEMSMTVLRRTGDNVAVLAYRAEASREGAEPYRTFCSSTYLKSEHNWRLVQHQHTPV